MKILIDTDIGDDIDDALAILLAMELRLDIVGVTTVFLDTVARAQMVRKLLSLYGKGYEKIPVYAGHGGSLEFSTALCQATEDLSNKEYAPNSDDPEDAVDFIINCCEEYNEELCILAIGPFTNLARALRKNSEAVKKAGRIVIMGGCYFRQYADWNVSCDPDSAAVLFDSVEGIECIGADVTHDVGRISEEQNADMAKCRSESTARGYVAEMYRMWQARTNGSLAMLHDPLAVYYLSDPSILTLVKGRVCVITEGPARGMTLNLEEYKKAHMNPAIPDSTKTQKLAKEAIKGPLMARIKEIFA